MSSCDCTPFTRHNLDCFYCGRLVGLANICLAASPSLESFFPPYSWTCSKVESAMSITFCPNCGTLLQRAPCLLPNPDSHVPRPFPR